VGVADEEQRARRLPNKRIITSLIPSIMALLGPAERVAYRKAYYASSRSLAPVFWPNRYTHLAFVRAEAHTGGPTAATEVVQNIVEVGQNPGLPAWTALLLSLMGRGDVEAALHLLDAMERRAPLSETRRMPPPSGRTYAGLARIAAKHGRTSIAANLLQRYRKHGGVGGELGSLEAFFADVKRRDLTPEQVAEERRSQAATLRELDRLDRDDQNRLVRDLFDRRRHYDEREKEGEEKRAGGAGEKGEERAEEHKGAEAKVPGEHGEEKTSAFA
jgi:hypothetical protein